MFDVITVGSALKDVYLRSSKFNIVKAKTVHGKAILMDFGTKIDIDHIVVETGGGGTNTAVGFSRLGLKTAFFGKVGDDFDGKHILDVLRKEKVDTSLVKKSKNHITGYSTIMESPSGERTILVYRGANNFISKSDLKLNKFKTRWVYISPLANKSVSMIRHIIKHAKDNNIYVALNPSKGLISLGLHNIHGILRHVDILIMNREEASLLTKISYKKDKAIFKRLIGYTNAIIVMTEGKNGTIVCDHTHTHKSNSPGVRVINTVGAGDAFGCGFVTGIIEESDIHHAIRLGTINAISVIQKLSAKEGLLRKRDLERHRRLWNKIKIKKIKIKKIKL